MTINPIHVSRPMTIDPRCSIRATAHRRAPTGSILPAGPPMTEHEPPSTGRTAVYFLPPTRRPCDAAGALCAAIVRLRACGCRHRRLGVDFIVSVGACRKLAAALRSRTVRCVTTTCVHLRDVLCPVWLRLPFWPQGIFFLGRRSSPLQISLACALLTELCR